MHRPIYLCVLDHPDKYPRFRHPLFIRFCIDASEL